MINASPITKKQKTMRQNRIIALTIGYVLLAVFALFIIIPFYVIIVTSIKQSHALATSIPFIWFPRFDQLSFRAYQRLFTSYVVDATGMSMVLTGIINTMIVVIPTTIIGMLSSSVSAYAFAKIKFRGRTFLFNVLLFSMMLPGIILLIPSFIIYDTLALTNTFFPVMVPAMFGSAACVFFLRQFFSGIPDELVEAGKIDGMNHLRVFFQIMIPLSVPAILAQAVLGFLAGYNDYLGPLLYLKQENMYTLQIALQMFTGGNMKDLPTVMAGAIMALVPSVAIYIIAQKYFVAGIAMSGLKA